ncbi:MAG: ABC transporter permease [Phaeodactylibacter sp.]|nr:ABC transporter permease [Phaeodactylibacter sp.]
MEWEETVIEPGKIERNYLKDMWRYRELLYILSWRDIKVRYKQTAIGIIWAVLRPAITLIVFTVVFGRIAGLPSDSGVPYPILVLGGLLPWQFFSNAVSESSNSLIGNERLITKVYFPRILIPASAVVTSFIDFLIAFLLLLGAIVYYGFPISVWMLLIPVFLALVFLFSLGCGLILSALNVKFRDFRYIIPFVLQLGLFLSPVGFSTAVVPESWQLAYALNPLVGVINGFRWCITPDSVFPGVEAWLAAGVSLFTFFIGFVFFRKMERSFADII